MVIVIIQLTIISTSSFARFACFSCYPFICWHEQSDAGAVATLRGRRRIDFCSEHMTNLTSKASH